MCGFSVWRFFVCLCVCVCVARVCICEQHPVEKQRETVPLCRCVSTPPSYLLPPQHFNWNGCTTIESGVFFFLHLLWRSVLCNTCRSVSAYHQDASFIHMRIEKANLFLDSFLPPIIKKSYVESSFCKYSDLMLKSYSWKRSSLKAILQNFVFQEFPHFAASFLFPLVESVATPAHQV